MHLNPSFAETVENYEVVSPVVTYPDGKKVSYSGTSPLIAEVYLASVLILFCSGMLSLSQHQLAKMNTTLLLIPYVSPQTHHPSVMHIHIEAQDDRYTVVLELNE